MLIDLHTHSYPKSDDSFMAVDELILSAKAAGVDGVCLTEHDAFWSAAEASELSRRHGFLVLPGCELNTDTGHVLVFGLEEYQFGLHKPDYLRRVAAREGAVIVAAHPYRRRFLAERGQEPEARAEMLDRATADSFFRICDAIESVNGRGTDLENTFSQELATLLGTRMTGGSDAHRPEQLGTAATRFDRRIGDLDGLIRELRAGRFRPADLRNGHRK